MPLRIFLKQSVILLFEIINKPRNFFSLFCFSLFSAASGRGVRRKKFFLCRVFVSHALRPFRKPLSKFFHKFGVCLKKIRPVSARRKNVKLLSCVFWCRSNKF